MRTIIFSAVAGIVLMVSASAQDMKKWSSPKEVVHPYS
jgi:hypothetical protein